jgi:hypothetical protein
MARPGRVAFLALVGALTALGAISASQAAATFLGLTFPDRVAGAQIGPTTNFEEKAPGWGYGVRYRQEGWTIDVYIYDHALSAVSDDLQSDVLKSEVKEAQSEIMELQRRGSYAKVELLRDYVMRDPRGRPRFLCSDFVYTHEKLGNVDSYLCLTGWHDKFVKFRLTGRHHAGSDRDAKGFVEAWFPILWP